jgi:hypothetical protein
MKTAKSAIALLISVLFPLISVSSLKAQSPNPQKTLSVEGEWEQISASSDAWRVNNGRRMLVTRRGNGYEVKWWDGASWIKLSGNETRIVRTRLEYLAGGPGDRHGAGMPMPDSVKQQVAGQKVPINESFTLSADGLFLTQARDGRWVYWNTEETGQGKRYKYTHYEIKPGFYTATFKRISGPTAAPKAAPAPATQTAPAPPPAKKTATSPVAQVEARGDFYFLTKDGRKLTGAEAKKIPLEEGSKVVTGKGGHVRLILPDATTFTVGANSQIVIDKFVYDPDQSPKQVMVDLTKGVFRWVTGKTAPKYKAQMQVTLPVMAVGIRGTDFEAVVGPKGRGRVALYDGQLEITEKKSGFTFILNAGQMVTFTPDGKVSRPRKIKGAPLLDDEEDD